jgi:hypothetical protein
MIRKTYMLICYKFYVTWEPSERNTQRPRKTVFFWVDLQKCDQRTKGFALVVLNWGLEGRDLANLFVQILPGLSVSHSFPPGTVDTCHTKGLQGRREGKCSILRFSGLLQGKGWERVREILLYLQLSQFSSA